MYKLLIRPFLFLFDAEKVHQYVNWILHTAFKIPFLRDVFKESFRYTDPKLARNVFGLHFPNPVGLAAGFDKNGRLYNDLEVFGFGFVEIGTLTPKAQPGNEKPRLFRLISDEAIINWMGFNNSGAEIAAAYLKKHKPKLIIGGNIGKNKATPNEDAISDYLYCFDVLYDFVDYFTINISSPNTPGLRSLQDKGPLEKLLKALMARNDTKPTRKPMLLKIAPDLNDGQLDEIIDLVIQNQLDGIVATNTTLSREGLKSPKNLLTEQGGLSGKPLKNKSTAIIRYIYERTEGKLPIIGAGGIHSPEDAMEKINAGASLVQLYTGFIYEGPVLVKKIKRRLAENNV